MECKGPVKQWGAAMLGRVPEFVHHMPTLCAEEYKRKYEIALQFFVERCQHHIHPPKKCEQTKKEVRNKRRAKESILGLQMSSSNSPIDGKFNMLLMFVLIFVHTFVPRGGGPHEILKRNSKR